MQGMGNVWDYVRDNVGFVSSFWVVEDGQNLFGERERWR